MLKIIFALIKKDITLLLFRGGSLIHAVMLGLLLVFVLSISTPIGHKINPQSVATIFWLVSVLCQNLVLSGLYALEDFANAREELLIIPTNTRAIWVSKAISGLLLLMISQIFILIAMVILLGLNFGDGIMYGFCGILLADIGISALGSLLGATLNTGLSRESLLAILIFPLLIPIILAGIRIVAGIFGSQDQATFEWLLISMAYDLIFCGASWIAFPYVFGGVRE